MIKKNQNSLISIFEIIIISSFLLFSYGCKEGSEPTINAINSLSYKVDPIPEIKIGEAYVSEIPEVDAEGELTFGIANISNSNFTGLSIDENNGQITIVEGNALTPGITYVIDVSVSNQDLSEVFEGVFRIKINPLEIPSDLYYEPDSTAIASGIGFLSAVPNIEGVAPFAFSIDNREDVPAFIEIVASTGEISINQQNATPGNYAIDVKVSNEDGVNTFEGVYVVRILSPAPIANFEYSATNDDFTTLFDNTSQNAIAYEWDFGDGSEISTVENPLHTYAAIGSYQVTLSATNIDGVVNSVTKEVMVEETIPAESILQIISNSETHTQLEAFINANADLVTALEGTDLTLFAPNDNAFEKLRLALGVASLEQVNPNILAAVLAFHIHTGGAIARADMDASTSLSTVQGESITFNSNGNIATGGSDSDVEFIGDEIPATNGVVHVIETLLIPPSIFQVFATHLGKVSQTILFGADLSILAAAIYKADAYASATEGATPLTQVLASPDLDLTVFAPVNQVFTATGITLESFTAQQWYGLIANHILFTKILRADFVVGSGEVTAAGGVITILPSGSIDSNGVAGAEAQFVDGATDIESSNGVVHVINGVLAPASSGKYAIDEKYAK